MSRFPIALLVTSVAVGCVASPGGPGDAERGEPIGAGRPDDLYRDFLDGKFDGAGHPVGATVLEAGDGCAPETGERAKGGGWRLAPGEHEAGIACTGETRRLGRGLYHASLRAALEERPAECAADAEGDCAPEQAFRVRVLDADGEVLSEETFDADAFASVREWGNLAVAFTVRSAGRIRVEAHWAGTLPVRLEYVEVFRQDDQLVLSPPSGIVAPGADFRIEVVDPPDEALPRVRCNGEDVSDRLVGLVASAEATDERTDFRRILTAPADVLFEGCGPDRDVVVEVGETWTTATSEARYLAMGPGCDFEPGRAKVLVTGFVPFPAGSRSVNSSALAVESFDPASVPEASVMRLVLPVEFESAATIVRDVVARCRPDVVIGFGQGRWAVDLETTAYNFRDTSEVSGGVPDNRGVIFDGAPIDEDGPDELSTGLPVDAIEAALAEAGVDVRPSDDPGRYVCNDLFYSIMRAIDEATTGGFIHLPRIFRPTEEDVAMLRTVVREAVARSVEATAEG